MLAQRLRALSSRFHPQRDLKIDLYASGPECEIHAMDLRSLKLFVGWSAPLVAAILTTGCGNYRSDYIPPQDGRARAVWQEDRVVASLPAGAQGDCSVAVGQVQDNPTMYRTYYGGSPTIVVWQPWVVVRSSNSSYRPSSSAPRTAANPTAVRPGGGSGSGSGGSFGSGGSSGSSGGGSSGGGGDLGKAAVVLVVVAIMTLPIINVALGLGRPEPSKQVAQEIDAVNAYNDLSRLEGSPCSAAEAP